MSILKDNINAGPTELRKLINRGHVVAPGVFNGISALLAERAGFRALYLSGSGVAGCMGLPDLSLTTLSEVADETRKITSVSKLPLIVDIDTGFGETLNVMRTIRSIEAAGASAIHIEDQQLPKKCGHLSGKKIVPQEEMAEKVRMASESRNDKDFMIIARTDSRAVEGLDGSIERGKLYVKAGADAIFPEALESEDEFREYAKKVRAPLLANMTEFGKSPLLSSKELAGIGYKIIIFPLTGFRSALSAVNSTYSELSRRGTQMGFLDKLMTREKFYDVIGYKDYEYEDALLYASGIGGSKSHRK
jgi:methylisocitrate lyase